MKSTRYKVPSMNSQKKLNSFPIPHIQIESFLYDEIKIRTLLILDTLQMSNAERRLKNEEEGKSIMYQVQSTKYGLEFFSQLATFY